MKYHQLQVSARKSHDRVGRGIAAGKGKTAGRGTKGQKSRTGWSKRPGFAGGQTPLMQQLPKLPGFRSYKPKAAVVYLGQLEALKQKTVDAEALAEAGLIKHPYQPVKLLAKGKVTKAFTVRLPLASSKAVEALKTANGTFETVPVLKRTAKPKANSK